jgi:hypothetical protein
MAVGANDYIDKLLVRKYADAKMENHEMVKSAISPEKMYEIMNDYAASHRMALNLQMKLKNVANTLQSQAACRNYVGQVI